MVECLGNNVQSCGSAIIVHVAWSDCPGIRTTNDSYHPGGVKLSNKVCDDYLTMASSTPAIHSGNSIIISKTLPQVQISHTAMSLTTPISTMCTVLQMADINARFYVLTEAWLKIQFFWYVTPCHWLCCCQWMDGLYCIVTPWNVQNYTPNDKVSHLKRKASSLDTYFTFTQLIGQEDFTLNRRYKSLQLYKIITVVKSQHSVPYIDFLHDIPMQEGSPI